MWCLKPSHRDAWQGTPASAADSGHRGHGRDGTVHHATSAPRRDLDGQLCNPTSERMGSTQSLPPWVTRFPTETPHGRGCWVELRSHVYTATSKTAQGSRVWVSALGRLGLRLTPRKAVLIVQPSRKQDKCPHLPTGIHQWTRRSSEEDIPWSELYNQPDPSAASVYFMCLPRPNLPPSQMQWVRCKYAGQRRNNRGCISHPHSQPKTPRRLDQIYANSLDKGLHKIMVHEKEAGGAQWWHQHTAREQRGKQDLAKWRRVPSLGLNL